MSSSTGWASSGNGTMVVTESFAKIHKTADLKIQAERTTTGPR
jgi:hypothetical protein